MVLSLIGPLDAPSVQRVLLVAAYAGISLKVVPIHMGIENETEEYRLNCHPMQRVPALKTDEGYLFESNAIIRYLARTEVLLVAVTGSGSADAEAEAEKIPHPHYPVTYAMYGHSLFESTQVDSWLDFAATHIDFYTRYIQGDNGAAAAATAAGRGGPGALTREVVDDATAQLRKSFDGLERRLLFLKERRSVQLRQSGTLPAPSTMTEEELVMNEEDYLASRATRDARLSAVYNVADSIRHRHTEKERLEREKQLDTIKKTTSDALGEDGSAETEGPQRSSRRMSSARDSIMISATPRSSVLKSARGPTSGSGVAGSGAPAVRRHDLLFLVGDSLTAADVVVAMAVHGALSCETLRPGLLADYPNIFRYYKNVLTLPVAAEVGKAVRLNVVKS